MSNEFRVNGYQNNWQRDAHITTFRDGGFLVVYESYVNNYNDGPTATVVMLQRYDASGRRVGEEQIVDGIDGTKADDARVTTLTDGGFVVVWSFDNYDDILSTRDKVYARVYNADGTARTGAIRVDTVEANDAVVPEVFATAGGGFKVVFGVNRSADLFDQIYSQQFTASGVPVGTNSLVNTSEGQFDEIYARSATLTNGSSITVWNSEGALDTGQTLDSNQVRGTITNPSGTVTRGDFGLAINFGTPGGGSGAGYDVTALRSGGFAVTNSNYDFEIGRDTEETSYYIMLRLFDSAGQQFGPPRIVIASDNLANATRVAQLETGEIVVVWQQDDDAPGVIGDSIYGRILSSNGVPITDRFEIGIDRFNYDDQAEPEIAALAGGGFVVTYTSDSIDADAEGVAARVFGRGTVGNDTLQVDVSGHMMGLDGNDALVGNAGANRLDGGIGNDWLDGRAGNDALFGGTGGDRLIGREGADRLDGGLGADILDGGTGDDVYAVDNFGDRVIEGINAGKDTAYASVSHGLAVHVEDLILTGANAINGYGNAASNVLRGNAGANVLNGGAGADTLIGGGSADRLIGGADADSFIFEAPLDSGLGLAADRIVDFQSGIDKLVFTAIDAQILSPGNEAFAFIGAAAFSGVAGELRYASGVVSADRDGDMLEDLQVALISRPNLSDSDFLL